MSNEDAAAFSYSRSSVEVAVFPNRVVIKRGLGYPHVTIPTRQITSVSVTRFLTHYLQINVAGNRYTLKLPQEVAEAARQAVEANL
jgi:hypothetical protein